MVRASAAFGRPRLSRCLGGCNARGVVASFERGNRGGTVGFVAFLTSLEPIGWRVGVSSMAGH